MGQARDGRSGSHSDAPVRGSRILAVLTEIVHGPQGSMRAVEVAGRGIAAEARCTRAVLADKAHISDDPAEAVLASRIAYADLLIELGGIEDDLAGLWRARRAEEVDDTAFEQALGDVVARLEAWPAAAARVGRPA